MPDHRILTTESGAHRRRQPDSQTAGPGGPAPLQDQHLVEKLARFNRERIPERVVHAEGFGAYGHFEVTKDMSAYTGAKVLIGKSAPAPRSSSGSRPWRAAGGRQRPFVTRVASPSSSTRLTATTTSSGTTHRSSSSGTPEIPDFIHSQKPDPFTNRQEPENVWDFFSHSPEATHMFTWLFGDRGIPANYRQMDGFGSHTFSWTNAGGAVLRQVPLQDRPGHRDADDRGSCGTRRRKAGVPQQRPARGDRTS